MTNGQPNGRTGHGERVFAGDSSQTMLSAVAGGPGLVAGGYDVGRHAAAVWTSTDGIVWRRVAHDETAFGGNGLQAMFSVAAGGPGLVAGGTDLGRDAGAVWTTP